VRETVGTRVAVIHPPALSVAAIPGLIAALGRPDAQVRNTAASILMSFGPEARAAIPLLIAMARETWSDSTEMDRQRFNLDCLAIQTLTKIAVKTDSAGQVVAALIELVQEKSPTRCHAAVVALGEFGPAAESAVAGLIRALPWHLPRAANSLVRDPPVVIKALARIAPGTKLAGAAIAALGKVARTGTPDIQSAAADALCDFGPAAESAVPDLIRAIEAATSEKRYEVTWRASVALGRIAPGTKSAGDAIAALHALLRSRTPEPNGQIAAADALGDFGPAAERAVPDLIQILKNSSHDEAEVQVMSTVAGALARIAPGTPSGEEAIRILTGALDSRDWFIKQDAINHLGQLGPRAAGAIPRLRALTQDGMPEIRKVAEEALATIEGRK
jgi:HEAT repeat protein